MASTAAAAAAAAAAPKKTSAPTSGATLSNAKTEPNAAAAEQQHPIEALLGPILITNPKKTSTTTSIPSNSTSSILSDTLPTIPTVTAIKKDTKLLLLYFSASWCPPCQQFTPLLANFYLQFAKKASMEVVYVSSDRNVTDFVDYFTNKMPWLAVPLIDHDGFQVRVKLAKKTFAISGIPTLIVLDAQTGRFITADARSHILATAGQSSDTIYENTIVQKWLNGPRLTLEQAMAAPNYVWQILSFITKSFATIASNPAYIIGAAYLFRYAVRKYFAKKAGVDDAAIEDEASPAGNSIPDDEI